MRNDLIKILKEKMIIGIFYRGYEGKRRYLRKKGAKIGGNTRILSRISSFGSEPYLVTVGKDCLFSVDVKFITHDGGVSVLNNLNLFPSRADKLGPIEIGDNVFIGANTVIMPNVKVGNNVIIGAGSIVTKNFGNNSVVAGVPAKKIMSIEDYYKKIKNNIHYTTNMNEIEKLQYCISNGLTKKV